MKIDMLVSEIPSATTVAEEAAQQAIHGLTGFIFVSAALLPAPTKVKVFLGCFAAAAGAGMTIRGRRLVEAIKTAANGKKVK